MASQRKSIDLQQIVRNWADQQYERMATRKMKRLKSKKYITVNIDWSNVSFSDITEWPKLAEAPFTEKDKGSSDTNANGPVSEAKSRLLVPEMQASTKASILFETTFTNNTSGDQEYTMRTEKTTKSSCSTNIETGYTKGVDMCITLKTPCEIFEANAGFHREMSLTNATGETIEEEITWGVESHINVKKGHIANAMLIVNEKKYDGTFTVTSTIKGPVHVTFNNIKENSALVFAASDDVFAIVEDYIETQRNLNDPVDNFVSVQGQNVVIRTQGKCDFRYGVKQQVLVEQVPMPGVQAL